MIRGILLPALCLLLTTVPAAEPREVRVAVAANMKPAFEEIRTAVQKAHPDIKVTATYGASGTFFAQISNKAPFDVFLSADTDYPAKMVERGLANRDATFVYAIGKLVVWVPSSSALDVDKHGLRAATDSAVR